MDSSFKNQCVIRDGFFLWILDRFKSYVFLLSYLCQRTYFPLHLTSFSMAAHCVFWTIVLSFWCFLRKLSSSFWCFFVSFTKLFSFFTTSGVMGSNLTSSAKQFNIILFIIDFITDFFYWKSVMKIIINSIMKVGYHTWFFAGVMYGYRLSLLSLLQTFSIKSLMKVGNHTWFQLYHKTFGNCLTIGHLPIKKHLFFLFQSHRTSTVMLLEIVPKFKYSQV